MAASLVCHVRGWDNLRPDDCGGLWENLVLDALACSGEATMHHWRDKQHREVDFVTPRGRQAVDTIECNWSPKASEPRGLLAFREGYPKGRDYVVCPVSNP